MSNRPPFIEFPADSSSWDFRLDCMAWELYTKKSQAELAQFIALNKKLQTEDFANRLRKCAAWWWLAYLNRAQIVLNLQALSSNEEEHMRDHLNAMRQEIKKHRQIEFKTAKRGNDKCVN